MKSGSDSAVAFGRVLQAVRKKSSKGQADVAGAFNPKLSIAAISMAESGNRPPKTEAIVRGYAAALGLDEDDLLELWWSMQGMVELEDRESERQTQRWWRELGVSPQAEFEHAKAKSKASAAWTPNDDWYEPSLNSFALAEAICDTLERLLGDGWTIQRKPQIGLREIFDGRLATVDIVLHANPAGEGDVASPVAVELSCPEPVVRPDLSKATPRPSSETLPPDIAWILSSIEEMPFRERAAVVGFIRGLQAGSVLFSGPGASVTNER